jgi:hypothetical protein
MPNAFAMTVTGPGKVTSPDGLMLPADTQSLQTGTAVVAVMNPRAIRISRSGHAGEVTDVVGYPDHKTVEVRLGTSMAVVIHAEAGTTARRGDRVKIAIPATAVTVSPAS